ALSADWRRPWMHRGGRRGRGGHGEAIRRWPQMIEWTTESREDAERGDTVFAVFAVFAAFAVWGASRRLLGRAEARESCELRVVSCESSPRGVAGREHRWGAARCDAHGARGSGKRSETSRV